MAVLGGEPLEQRVRVGRVAHGERADLAILADAVEDDDAARPFTATKLASSSTSSRDVLRPPAWRRL